jgi:hypothetical protein
MNEELHANFQILVLDITNETNGGINLTDQEKALFFVDEFIKDKTKRILLLKGYDQEAKIKVTLSILNKYFKKGIIRTSHMSNISMIINSAFEKDILPNNVKSTTNYKLGNMRVNINSYSTHTKSNPIGSDDTFTLFVPVQSVLDSNRRYENFLNEIEKTKSRKIILITTNEWSIKNWDIKKHIDDHFFYDVENDNPQIMKNLRNNKAI